MYVYCIYIEGGGMVTCVPLVFIDSSKQSQTSKTKQDYIDFKDSGVYKVLRGFKAGEHSTPINNQSSLQGNKRL